MTRFPTPGHLASWAGLCPGNNESAGKHNSTPTRSGESVADLGARRSRLGGGSDQGLLPRSAVPADRQTTRRTTSPDRHRPHHPHHLLAPAHRQHHLHRARHRLPRRPRQPRRRRKRSSSPNSNNSATTSNSPAPRSPPDPVPARVKELHYTRCVGSPPCFDHRHDVHHGRTSPTGSWRSGGVQSAAAPRTGTHARDGHGSTARTPAGSVPTAAGATSATALTASTRRSMAPLRRATSRERSHAVREPDVLVGGRRDTSGRAVTLCGAFARPARPRARGHVRFVSDVPWSCRSCTLLGGLNPAPP